MNEPGDAIGDLDALLDPQPRDDGRFIFHVPDGWHQGRGTFGGLVLGALLRAVARSEPDASRSVRAVTGEIPAPVLPGETTLRVEALRRGGAVSTWRATMEQSGEAVAQLVAVLGAPRRGGASWQPPTAPTPPPWNTLDVLPFMEGVAPEFAAHMEFRSTGPWPFSSHHEALTEGWVRTKVPFRRRDVAWVCALADAYWPASFSMLAEPRAMSTITFTLELLADPSTLSLDTPVFHRGRSPAASEGYSVEFRELWTPDGTLLALNQQTFVTVR